MKHELKTLFALALTCITFMKAEQVRSQTVHFQSGNSLRNNQVGHYYKMVSFDDQQYQEFFYSATNSTGGIIEFMNWRAVFPPGYQQTSSTPYPMIVMLHGAGESGRAWGGHFAYDATDPRYDNNDNNLLWGGKEHLDAVNSSPSSARAFPGIVIFPQVSYSGTWSGDWNDGTLNDNGRMAIGIIEYMIENYNVDQYKISIHGLSGGAKGVWDLAAKRPDLFCSMLPMSGVGSDINAMTDVLVTTPLWLFQGGQDTNPSPGYAQQWINALKGKGGTPRYTLYPNLDHGTWNTAYQEPDFFSWMRAQDKRNVYVFGGSTSLDDNPSIKLGVSAGFLEYQWMVDGTEISGATSRFYTATRPGSYSVKFRRRTDNLVDQSFSVRLTQSQGPPPPPPDAGPTNGLSFNYYEYTNSLTALSSFDFNQAATLSGNINNFYTSPSQRSDHFVLSYDGLINIKAGTYRFYTKSQDGSTLYINGQLVVNNDGQHQAQVVSNTFKISSDGKYPIRVAFFNQSGNPQLQVGYNPGTTDDFSLANMLADVNLFLPGSSTTYSGARTLASAQQLPIDTLTIKDHSYEVAVFPNPFQEYIRVWFLSEQTGTKMFSLRDVHSGRIVRQCETQLHDNEAIIDCHDLPAGMYILTADDRHFRMLKIH